MLRKLNAITKSKGAWAVQFSKGCGLGQCNRQMAGVLDGNQSPGRRKLAVHVVKGASKGPDLQKALNEGMFPQP